MAAAAKEATKSSPTLLKYINFIYQARPKALYNCATLPTTKVIAEDPSHPFNRRTLRRMKEFDPTKLHILVRCPKRVIKLAFIRGHVAKWMRQAIWDRLRELGFEKDGSRIDPQNSPPNQSKLGGALFVVIKNQEILLASKEEFQDDARWLIDRVIALRNKSLRTSKDKGKK